MPQIAARSNLELAFWKAARGRRDTGAVRRYAADLDGQLNRLAGEIQDGSVVVGNYHRFVVFDPKQRTIHAAPFPQRILHHAIMNICGGHFERGASDRSYACRAGRGNQAALLQARHFAARHRYYLKLDIRRYFDSVDQTILAGLFRRRFKDADLLALLDRILQSYQTAAGKGLPIGTLTSQYFANFYLDALDRFIAEGLHCPASVRYMDDFALWADDAGQLGDWRDQLGEWLAAQRRLSLKPGTPLRETTAGMPFLGMRILPGAILLGRRARRRFRTRFRDYEGEASAGRMTEAELQRRVTALVAHTEQARCRSWRRLMLGGAPDPTSALL